MLMHILIYVQLISIYFLMRCVQNALCKAKNRINYLFLRAKSTVLNHHYWTRIVLLFVDYSIVLIQTPRTTDRANVPKTAFFQSHLFSRWYFFGTAVLFSMFEFPSKHLHKAVVLTTSGECLFLCKKTLCCDPSKSPHSDPPLLPVKQINTTKASLVSPAPYDN